MGSRYSAVLEAGRFVLFVAQLFASEAKLLLRTRRTRMRFHGFWSSLAASAFGIACLAGVVPVTAVAQVPTGCTTAIDPCCAARPAYSDPQYTFGGDVLVATRQTEPGTGAVVTIFDITQPYTGDGVNFASVVRYHGPGDSWNDTNLGSVFGLTIDAYGNIFVCQTTCYGLDPVGPGGNGAVYRIAGGTGAIGTFVNLPNVSGVGLGNISYDCEHDQFFVTDEEDGKIYRVKAATTNGPTATIQESFDPSLPDDGTPGYAPLGERLWGVQWHAGRVYYGVWSQNCNETTGPPNSVRSVALDGSGAFIPGSDQLEIVVPPHVNNYSHPVSDITFSPRGTMLLAERSMSGPSSPAAHESRLLEYVCQNGAWVPNPNPYVLGVAATCCCSGIAGNGTNSAGGVDCDFAAYSPTTPFGRVWGTSDAINGSLTVYGIQGLPPGGGTPAASAWVDFDGSTSGSEKTAMGDVEVPCADVPTSSMLLLFTAAPAGEALALRWEFGQPQQVETVALERAEDASGPWETITAERSAEGNLTVALDRNVQPGHGYYYRLQVNTTTGERLTFGPVVGTPAGLATGYSISRLSQNPSRGPVQFEFSVPRESSVRVSVVDVQGRQVALLADGTYRQGRYTVTWNGNPAGSAARGGLYFVQFRTPAGSLTRGVLLTP
jgi:hypothetical protein